jgi:hypothetical protein
VATESLHEDKHFLDRYDRADKRISAVGKGEEEGNKMTVRRKGEKTYDSGCTEESLKTCCQRRN